VDLKFWTTRPGVFVKGLPNFNLRVEPAELLVEFGLDGLALVPLAAVVAEQRLDAVQELLLPLADLDPWTWKARDNSARVLVCLAVPRATRALKLAACCFLRVLAMTHLRMQQRASISLASRVVQFHGSTSVSRSNRTAQRCSAWWSRWRRRRA